MISVHVLNGYQNVSASPLTSMLTKEAEKAEPESDETCPRHTRPGEPVPNLSNRRSSTDIWYVS